MSYIVHSVNDKLAVTAIAPNVSAESVISKVVAPESSYLVVDKLDIDSAYFNAYEFDGKTIVLNIEKAKEIHREFWRAKRAARFVELDTKYLIASELKAAPTKTKIAALKASLRDVTKTKLPNTLDKIKAVWPECLEANI